MGLKPFNETITAHDRITATCIICRHAIRPGEPRVRIRQPYLLGPAHPWCATASAGAAK